MKTLLNRNTDSKEGIHINFGGKTLLFFKTGVPKKEIIFLCTSNVIQCFWFKKFWDLDEMVKK